MMDKTQNKTDTVYDDVAEILSYFLVSSSILGLFNSQKQKKNLALWKNSKERKNEQQKFLHTICTLRPKADQLQKQLKQSKGFVILRAYYGLKADIRTYLNLESQVKDQYWHENQQFLSQNSMERGENLGELFIVNVTTSVRFKLDNSFGGLKIGTDSGK